MKTEHTPGKLKHVWQRHSDGSHDLVSPGIGRHQGAVIATCGQQLCDDGLLAANAEHLAACWNVCDGINPEAVPNMLAALKQMIDPSSLDDGGAMARAAIAKATGEKNWNK